MGAVLSLECSRLARNNADWHRPLDLAGMTATLSPTPTASTTPGCSTTAWCRV